jgi:hypothetical protein
MVQEISSHNSENLAVMLVSRVLALLIRIIDMDHQAI